VTLLPNLEIQGYGQEERVRSSSGDHRNSQPHPNPSPGRRGETEDAQPGGDESRQARGQGGTRSDDWGDGERQDQQLQTKHPAASREAGEVRGTIGFDDETRLLAEEIDNKWSDGMLASKFGVHDLPAAQTSAKASVQLA